jgi:hypothetical protein
MDFFFKLEFSSQGVSADLLKELTAQVLQHVGSSPDALPDLAEALQKAVATGTSAPGTTSGPGDASRRCDVQFRAHGGTLDIVVSANGGRVWQVSHPIS